jgi:hypothetical protein
VSAVGRSHVVWLVRRASILDGTSPDTAEPSDPARAALLYVVADKVSRAVDQGGRLTLTPTERTLLVTEAHELAVRAAREVRRPAGRDLRRGEEWVLTARALREVAETARE